MAETPVTIHGTRAPQGLVDLLLACHDRIRRFVALARDAATRPDVPADQVVEACARVERYFREALPLHVADEEQSVEPRLRGRSPEVDHALDAMAQEHRAHEAAVAALLDAAAAVRPDPGDAARKTTLAHAAEALREDFLEHLALEEAVLFPAIRRLPADLQSTVVDELRARRRAEPPWYRVVVGDPLLVADPFAEALGRFRALYTPGSPARMLTRLETIGGLHCRAVAYLSPRATELARELGGEPTAPPTGADLVLHIP